jgi:valyl-tRNA synthetase
MPYITEELWLKVAPLLGASAETVMTQPYPRQADYPADPPAAAEVEWLKTVVLGVRRIRAESNLEPARKIPLQVKGGSADEQAWLGECTPFIQTLARLERIERVEHARSDATAAIAGETTLLVPLLDLIDPAVEADRLAKEIVRLEQDLARVNAKLSNDSFVARAPVEVVEKERKRAADNADAIERIQTQLRKLRPEA